MSQKSTGSHTPGKPWWDAFRAEFPEGLIACFEAEARATSARIFNVSAFPVQVQEPGYMAAVLRSYQGSVSDALIEHALAARALRREAFLRDGLRASIIVDAAVLRRQPVGPEEILRDQHEWARQLHSSGRVPIRVMDGFYTGMNTSFSLFTVDGEVVAFEDTDKKTIRVEDPARRDELLVRFEEFEQCAIDLRDHSLLMAA